MSLSARTRERLRQSAIAPLVVSLLVLAALIAATAALADALSPGASPPQPISLQALATQLTREQAPDAVSGRFDLVNHLLPSAQQDAGGDQPSSPLQAGGSGRFWFAAPDELRIELQGSGGDIELVRDGDVVWFYDGSGHTADRIQLPADTQHTHSDQAAQGAADQPPSTQQIADAIARLEQHWNVTGPTPTVQGNRGAYALAFAPRQTGSLLASLAGAVDAATGLPLRFEVNAVGFQGPVLSISVTHLTVGPTDPSIFAFVPPPGATISTTKLQNLRSPKSATASASHGGRRHARDAHHATTLAAAQQVTKFGLDAPATAGGQPLDGIEASADTALLRYGDGPGAILVLERATHQPTASGAAKPAGRDAGAGLPRVGLSDGSQAQELSTPLGTVLNWRHAGVAFFVAASRPAADVVAVAQSLATA